MLNRYRYRYKSIAGYVSPIHASQYSPSLALIVLFRVIFKLCVINELFYHDFFACNRRRCYAQIVNMVEQSQLCACVAFTLCPKRVILKGRKRDDLSH